MARLKINERFQEKGYNNHTLTRTHLCYLLSASVGQGVSNAQTI